jgi:hypothetical protein
MKTLLVIGLLIATQSILMYDKVDSIITDIPEIREEVYAGRHDKAVGKYNELGLHCYI